MNEWISTRYVSGNPVDGMLTLFNKFKSVSFRVYDLEYRKIVQTNVGHTDSVRDIIHLPERQQVKSNFHSTVLRPCQERNKMFTKTSCRYVVILSEMFSHGWESVSWKNSILPLCDFMLI